jgi:hypothetical protein
MDHARQALARTVASVGHRLVLLGAELADGQDVERQIAEQCERLRAAVGTRRGERGGSDGGMASDGVARGFQNGDTHRGP